MEIHLFTKSELIDIFGLLPFGALWIILEKLCLYFSFPFSIWLELLAPLVILFEEMSDSSKATTFYILIGRSWRFHCLHITTNTYFFITNVVGMTWFWFVFPQWLLKLNIFHVLFDHLYISFGEMSILEPLPIFKLSCLFLVETALYPIKIQFFYQMNDVQKYFPYLSVVSLFGVLWRTKVFYFLFWWYPFIHIFFCCL